MPSTPEAIEVYLPNGIRTCFQRRRRATSGLEMSQNLSA